MVSKPKKVKKIVLAYSGGLDTSVILPWLRETYNCPVIAFAAELGQGQELEGIRKKALASGASKCIVADLRQEFAQDYLWPMLRCGAVYEERYLLGTSIARPLIAKHQVAVAKAEGADAVAHGATGKGNDQVRFELTYMSLAPELEIIAPWKDDRFGLRSREAAVEYAREHGIPVDATKKKIYSRDRNLWHLSHEGADLEDPANEPREDLWLISRPVSQAPDKPQYVSIDFVKGNPVALNGKKMLAWKLLEQLNKLAGRHAVGQTDLVENRLVGIKNRGAYETPGGSVLYEAHRALESITLDRDTAHYKQQLALRYAELVYYGKWFSPLRRALDAFVNVTQQNVTGQVKMQLFKGRATVAALSSPYSLYVTELASFTMGSEYQPKDAIGFIRLFGLQQKIQARLSKSGRAKKSSAKRKKK